MTQPRPDARLHFRAAQDEFPLPGFGFDRFVSGLDTTALPDDQTRFTDLYLARACANGVTGAHEFVMRRHGASIRQALGRMRLSDEQRDEAQAALLRILFVGEGSGPAIAGYKARGSLDGWLRVSATRAAHRVLRSSGPTTAPLTVDESTFQGVWRQPEARVLLEEFREVFRDATAAALAQLSAPDRRALRQHYGDPLSIDVLAQAWGVHRATAARRVGRVRVQLRTAVLNALGAHFGTSNSSAARLVQRAQSQLSGAGRLLAETRGGADLSTR